MHFTAIPAALLLLAQAANVFAVPALPLQSRTLAADDVIVLGNDGSATVMKDYEYTDLQRRAEKANNEVRSMAVEAAKKVNKSKRNSRKGRRGCEQSTEVQVLTDDTFLNWDVVMSPVVSALGGTSVVAISDGYSIANSLTETINEGLSIESILSLSFSVSYSETWTSSSTSSFTFTVPDGQYGVIVSEPSVRRMTGFSLTGCTDSWDKEAFTSDTYTTQSYGGMEWPSGVIRLCNSTQYPVPFCVGSGSHS